VNQVTVNGEDENRRGRKLRVGDVISLPEGEFEIV
jgi:ribosome-associated protein YbcJ (S4-like RNA binding protein)